MNDIKIGQVIQRKRKLKGITQEELANHLSISKAAISKWELGQSHPDICMLPLLANFFEISIDELISYEPNLSKNQIRDIYSSLKEKIKSTSFEVVFREAEEYIKKYYSCYELQIAIAQFYFNYCNYAKDKELLLKNIIEKCSLVLENSKNNSLFKEAISIKATCYLLMNNPSQSINLLKGLCFNTGSFELLLASSYYLNLEYEKSEYTLQKLIFVNVISTIQACSQIITQSKDDNKKVNDYLNKALSLIDLFNIEECHEGIVIQVHLTISNIYALNNNKEKALDAIEKVVKIISKPKLNLNLKTSKTFDLLDGFFDKITLGESTPISNEDIVSNFKNFVLSNPNFKILKNESKYKTIIKKIESL